jgi:hypothetical protein
MGSCLASYEWQTPLVARYYLNISYGMFEAKFHLQMEAVERGWKDEGLGV